MSRLNLHIPEPITDAVAEAHAHRVVAAEELVAELVAALRDLVAAGEQEAADDGEDDLIEATPHLDAARAALARAEGAAS